MQTDAEHQQNNAQFSQFRRKLGIGNNFLAQMAGKAEKSNTD